MSEPKRLLQHIVQLSVEHCSTFLSLSCMCVQVKKAAPLEASSTNAPSQSEDIAIGKLRGEDYNFEFNGKVKDGKMHFRLFMTQV